MLRLADDYDKPIGPKPTALSTVPVLNAGPSICRRV
jgi:hypothetical protein